MRFDDLNIYFSQHVTQNRAVQAESKKKQPEVNSTTQVFKKQVNQVNTDSGAKGPLKSALKKKKVRREKKEVHWKEHQSVRMYKGENWMQTSVSNEETVQEVLKQYEMVQEGKKRHHGPKKHSNDLTPKEIQHFGHRLSKMENHLLEEFYCFLYNKAQATYPGCFH